MLLFTREKPIHTYTHTNQTHIYAFSLIPLAFLIFFIGSLQLPLIKIELPSLLVNSLKCIIKMIFLKRHNVISNYLKTLLLKKQTNYKIITCGKKKMSLGWFTVVPASISFLWYKSLKI